MPLLLLFALTLFTSATLLFLVQPMIGKMLLPMLGGTPAVWNTCMVFFQALLLAGYAYAHATTAWLGVRRQAALHLGVLLLPFLTLGLTIHRGFFEYGEGSPIPGLLLALLLSVGLPFFAVSTSAPLLQKWFADTGHPAAKDPYFLYGASNLGSMLALFGYPTVVEPALTLANQRLLWQIGYGILFALIALCAVCLWKSRGPAKEIWKYEDKETETSTGSAGTMTVLRRLRWVLLAFVPSSLMLGATTYMTTDIAAIAFLWVLPLGLYLLSFILVFSRLPAAVHRLMVTILPFLVLLLVFLMLSEITLPIWSKILVHLAVLFVTAMVCHGELARDRPPTRYLTEFYLWMSVGGVLGGLFNALIAPVIFNGIVEYPLALVLACLLTPLLEEEKAKPVRLNLGLVLMGCFLGAGVTFLLIARGRTDLDTTGLSGRDGLWLLAALAAALVLVWGARQQEGDDPAARWLDLGLPVTLGVLAVGLNLGLRIPMVHRGVDLIFAQIFDALPDWVPPRLAAFFDPETGGPLILCIFVVPVVFCSFFINRPLRFGLGVGALLLSSTICSLLDEDIHLRQRSFFGVLHVTDDGNFRRLEHGTTLHGQQRFRWSPVAQVANAVGALAASDPLAGTTLLTASQDAMQHPGRDPLTYFHRTGPIGQVFQAYQDKLAKQHVGLIGLGSGTLASYGQPGQKVTYFEIDPLVKHIAFDRANFTYVQDALDRGVQLEVVLGDARLKLEERANQGPPDKLALLVIDAFSSDAIPIHLITREAMDIYLKNLADDGIVVFHISNRYLDLEPVLGNLAAERGLVGYIENDNASGILGKTASSWVVLTRKESKSVLDRLVHEDHWEQWQAEHGWKESSEALQLLSAFPDAEGCLRAQQAVCQSLYQGLRAPWRKLKTRQDMGVWTDDYSNLLRVFDWKN